MPSCLRRLAIFCTAVLGALTMSSCLEEYDEEMVIHPDFSGEATVTVKLPDMVLDKYDKVQSEFTEANMRKRFEKASGVTLQEYAISDDRHPVVTMRVTFSSLDALTAAAKDNAPAQMLVGEFTIVKEGDNTVVERRLGKGTPTMSLPADKFANYKMHFEMPVEVMHTDSGFVDKSHGDLRYRWSLADIEAQQPGMVNQVLKPLPWLWIGLSVAGLVLLAWILKQQVGNLKKRKPKVKEVAKAEGPKGGNAPPPGRAGGQGPPQRPGPPRRPGPGGPGMPGR